MTAFEKYDKENPQIWAAFQKYAFEAKSKGFKHYGAKSIFEVIRWNTKVKGNDGFKLNNNYTSMYARKMMREHKEFEGFFELRKVKA